MNDITTLENGESADSSNSNYTLGAIIDSPAPQLKEPNYDIKKRDQLYERLQQLKSQNLPSLQTEILALEKEITEMLER